MLVNLPSKRISTAATMEAPPFAYSASTSSLFSLRNKPLSSPTITHLGNTKPSKSFSVGASSSRDSGSFSLLQKSPLFCFFVYFFVSVSWSFAPEPLIFLSYFSVVTLLDYGAGNVRSVRNAIRFLGFDIKDVSFLHHYIMGLFFFFSFLLVSGFESEAIFFY